MARTKMEAAEDLVKDLDANTSGVDNTDGERTIDVIPGTADDDVPGSWIGGSNGILPPGYRGVIGEDDQGNKIPKTQADLFAMQERQRIQALAAQKKAALANLEREREKVNPAFNTALSNVAGQSSRNARTLAEYLAQRGQTQSGIAAQSEMQRQSDLITQHGQLEDKRTEWLSDLALRESNVKNDYEQAVADARAERAYQELSHQLEAQERDRQESIATVGQYYNNFQAQINKIEQMEAMGDTSLSYLKPYLMMARQDKITNQQAAAAEAAQQEFINQMKLEELAIKQGTLDLNWQKYLNPITRSGGGGGSSKKKGRSGSKSGTTLTVSDSDLQYGSTQSSQGSIGYNPFLGASPYIRDAFDKGNISVVDYLQLQALDKLAQIDNSWNNKKK